MTATSLLSAGRGLHARQACCPHSFTRNTDALWLFPSRGGSTALHGDSTLDAAPSPTMVGLLTDPLWLGRDLVSGIVQKPGRLFRIGRIMRHARSSPHREAPNRPEAATRAGRSRLRGSRDDRGHHHNDRGLRRSVCPNARKWSYRYPSVTPDWFWRHHQRANHLTNNGVLGPRSLSQLKSGHRAARFSQQELRRQSRGSAGL